MDILKAGDMVWSGVAQLRPPLGLGCLDSRKFTSSSDLFYEAATDFISDIAPCNICVINLYICHGGLLRSIKIKNFTNGGKI